MFKKRGSKPHRLFFVPALVVVTVIFLLVASATAQQPSASQPSGRYFVLPGPQTANAPPVHIPVAQDQKKPSISAATSLAPSFSTGVYPTGGVFAEYVAVGDLNGDGWPDLAVANYCAITFMSCVSGGGSVAVFMGNGGGGFSGPATYASGGTYTYATAIVDVNGDGKLDVLAANSCSAGGPCFGIGELLGNGDGSLQAAQQYSGGWPGGGTSAAAMADLNGDGILDSVSVSEQGSSVYVQLGNADGTFQPAVVYSSGGGDTTAVAIADVNGDGYPDILAVNQCADLGTCGNAGATGSVGVLIGNGDGTFQPTVSFGTGGVGSNSITVADVNLDGKPDLLVANDCDDQGTCPSGGGTLGVLINATPYTATTTTLVSSSNPSIVGHAVTFTATVKPYSGTAPDGEMITFKNGATVLGTAPLSDGAASLTTAALPMGTFTITATYAFDGTYGASASPQIMQQVDAARRYSTFTSVTASPNPCPEGQTVTLTATVSARFKIPDGEQVAFYSGTTVIGTGSTVGGVATFSTSSLAPATYAIQAVYHGDPTSAPSGATLQLVVTGLQTGTVLSPSSNVSTYGQAVTFSAIVYSSIPPEPPSCVMPTGTVNFMANGVTLGSATLAGVCLAGQAILSISTLNAGSYPVTAVYSGDSVFAPSTSSVVGLQVLQTTTAAALVSSANPSTRGQAVTFTATITSPTIVPTGRVLFRARGRVMGAAQLSGGTASFTTSWLPVGSTGVTVTYFGDSNVGGSSASVAQTVQQ
ncbi:MAG: Ig-like domain repeat protein [Candidatus Sulfotelmatobacter sp.]